MKNKMSVPELSQATRLEVSVIRNYEYNTDIIIDVNHLNIFKIVFKNPNAFFGMTPYEAQEYANWYVKQFDYLSK